MRDPLRVAAHVFDLNQLARCRDMTDRADTNRHAAKAPLRSLTMLSALPGMTEARNKMQALFAKVAVDGQLAAAAELSSNVRAQDARGFCSFDH